MELPQIIEELQIIKEYFMSENDGCYPMALEEAQRVIKEFIEVNGFENRT